MKYLLLICNDEQLAQAMTKDQGAVVHDEYMSFLADLRKKGQLIVNHGIEPSTKPTTVRVREGKVLVTDGPFVEAKEQVGGFFLVEAKDLNEALQIAGRIPSARYGSIEVRQIWEFPKSENKK